MGYSLRNHYGMISVAPSYQQTINDYKVVIFYLRVDAPIRLTVVLDRKLIVLQRTN